MEAEDFEKKPIQVGESERYFQFKVAVMATEGAQNDGNILQTGADVTLLERQQAYQTFLETKKRVNRDIARAIKVAEAAYTKARNNQEDIDWQRFHLADDQCKRLESWAQPRQLLGRDEYANEELNEIEKQVHKLQKQRVQDSKGCGVVIEKIMKMVDTECK